MEIRTYFELVLSRKWIILQAMAIISVIAYGITASQVSIYQASAKIFLKGSQGESIFPESSMQLWNDPDRSIQTQIELIKSTPIAAKVVKNLGLEVTPEDLAQSIGVKPVKGTDVLELSYVDEVPERARDVVNIYAQEYITSRREASISQLSLAIRQLKSKIEDVKIEQFDLAKELTENNDTSKRRLESEFAFTSQFYMLLAEKHEMLKVDQALKKGGAELYQPASIPSMPINASPMRNGIAGLMAGMMLGFGMVFLLEHMDNTIKNPDDVMEHYGLPTIGLIPSKEFQNDMRLPSRSLVFCLHPKSSTAEAYRGLRNNLKFINHDDTIQSIMVTSALPGEGKTTTTVNLAAALAEIGNRVIVLDCDLRRPMLHKTFKVSNSNGVSNLIVDDLPVDFVIQETEIKGLRVITSGPVPPVASDLLTSASLLRIVEECKADSDIVIIDSPPTLAVTDSTILASVSDGALILVDTGKSTIEAAKQFKSIFDKTGARLLGVVLNNIDAGRHTGGYYYYSYDYKNPYMAKPSGNDSNNGKKQRPQINTIFKPIEINEQAESPSVRAINIKDKISRLSEGAKKMKDRFKN